MRSCKRLPAVLLLLLPLLPARGSGAEPPLSWKPETFESDAGDKVEAERGTLSVPLDRERPEGRRIEIGLVRFKSTSPNPGPPVVYLAGGPGAAAVEVARGARFPILMALREAGDVLVPDQRGTGTSAPFTITCRESWTHPADRGEMLAEARDRSRSCAGFLARSGVDLAAYNNDESADDLEDLRRALGVSRLSLWGESYGTQLALHLLKRHPDGIHRAVLSGVKGPDHTLRLPADVEALLREVGRLAREDPGVRTAVPDLPGLLRSLLDRLEKQPVSVEVLDRVSGRKVPVQAGRFDLQLMVAQALGSLDGIRRLPAALHTLAGGDFTSLGEFAYRRRKGWLGSALPYVVNCSSGASAERLERIRAQEKETLLGRAMDFPFPEICEGWGVPDLGPASRAAVRSNVPALFLGGTLDARTPVSGMEEVAAGFPNGVTVVVENAGHGEDLLLASPEIPRLMAGFLAGAAPGKTRLAASPPRFEPVPAAPAASETSPPDRKTRG